MIYYFYSLVSQTTRGSFASAALSGNHPDEDVAERVPAPGVGETDGAFSSIPTYSKGREEALKETWLVFVPMFSGPEMMAMTYRTGPNGRLIDPGYLTVALKFLEKMILVTAVSLPEHSLTNATNGIRTS